MVQIVNDGFEAIISHQPLLHSTVTPAAVCCNPLGSPLSLYVRHKEGPRNLPLQFGLTMSGSTVLH